MTDFASWLDSQLKQRGWSKSDLAEKAGVDTGTISNLTNDIRRAGPEVCRKLARALNTPQKVVFYHAGIMTEPPDFPEMDPLTLEVVMALQDRASSQVEVVHSTVFSVLEALDRGTTPETNQRDRAGNAGAEPS